MRAGEAAGIILVAIVFAAVVIVFLLGFWTGVLLS